MGNYVSIDMSEFEKFFRKMGEAGRDFKKDLALFLEAMGEDFLVKVQDEIIKKGMVNTRLLLQSFTKGDEKNVFVLQEGNLTVEVGTNLEYADWVNKGHITVTANSPGAFYVGKFKEVARWVPGKWKGEKFEYDPSAKTGMLLKQHYVPGTHYWDNALTIMEKMLPGCMEAFMQDWIDTKFGELL